MNDQRHAIDAAMTPEAYTPQGHQDLAESTPNESMERLSNTIRNETAAGLASTNDDGHNSQAEAALPHARTTEVVADQSGPLGTTVSRELAELRVWRQQAKEQQELEQLRAMKAKFEAGDRSVINDAVLRTTPPVSGQISGLPRPEPPQRFRKEGRSQYDRWKRDCEQYFNRVPTAFQSEQLKVDFGLQYVSEPLKTLWNAYRTTKESESSSWIPTWREFREVMLNTLGSALERRQQAFEKLKMVRQRPNQSPTDLLDHLRPLWEELGETHGPELQVLEFTAALSDSIRQSLLLLPEDRRNSIPTVEESANVIWRQFASKTEPKDKKSEGGQKPSEQSGVARPHARGERKRRGVPYGQNGPRRGHPAQSGRGRGRPAQSVPSSDAVVCWNCNQPGHFQSECPKRRKPDTSPAEASSGKGKRLGG